MKNHISMCRILARMTLVLILSGISLNPAAAQPRTGIVGFALHGQPVNPRASELFGEFIMTELFPVSFLEWTSIRAWYVAATPYLYPGDFFELGATARWNMGGMDRAPLSIGIGSAFSMSESVISIPLILELEGCFGKSRVWSLSPQVQGLIYGEGFIASARIRNDIMPFRANIGFSIGANLSYVNSRVSLLRLVTWGLSAGLFYVF